MADLHFLDTNIFLYAISLDPAEQAKRERAQELIDRDDAALSMQVLHEFMSQATHYRRNPPLSVSDAWKYVQAWRRFPIQENTVDVLDAAYAIHQAHKFSFWDCLIIAAAQALGCMTLHSEDMQHGRIVDRLRIVNPFR